METKNQYQKPNELGQDIYDLLIQEYGSVEAVFLLLEDNANIDLEEMLETNQNTLFRVELPAFVPYKTETLQLFRNGRLRVNCKDGEVINDNDNPPAGALLTANNVPIIVRNPILIGLNINSVILTQTVVPVRVPSNALTSSTDTIITQANGNPIVVSQNYITANTGDFITAANGAEIYLHPPIEHYLQTPNQAAILAANGKKLLL